MMISSNPKKRIDNFDLVLVMNFEVDFAYDFENKPFPVFIESPIAKSVKSVNFSSLILN